MAESVEHKFLSDLLLEIVNKFSASDLYSYRESDRKKFDYSCNLKENWDYSLDGQTLWKHTEGVDKDVRTLVVTSNAQIRAYIARDTVKNRSVFFEASRDFKSAGHASALNRLKIFWVPYDFDADNDSSRQVVMHELTSKVVNDILFNVIFGRLTPGGVRAILVGSGMTGLETAVLHHIGTQGFVNFSDLRKRFQVSPNTLRERVSRLQRSRFLLQPRGGGQDFYVSPAGRSYLRLCAQVWDFTLNKAVLKEETREILRLLELEPNDEACHEFRYTEDMLGGKTPMAMFKLLVMLAATTPHQWGVDWNEMSLAAHPEELDSARWLDI